jgi:hypothetical protein
MSNSIYELLTSGHEFCAKNLVLGGDYSEQSLGGNVLACYAVSALRRDAVLALDNSLKSVIARHVHDARDVVELHATDIWNKSRRERTAFRCLEHKDAMKLFFAEICEAIIALKPMIAVSVKCVGGPIAAVGTKQQLKQLLVYAAFSRLNTNLRIVSGEYLGQPAFIHDRESESLAVPERRKDTENPSGGLMDILPVPGMQPDSPQFFRAFDPKYRAADSREHRLIQVADIAAYFVGKHLRLRAQIFDAAATVNDRRSDLVKDCNFCFELWEKLNLEVVLVVFEDERTTHPAWIRPVVEPYEPMFAAGIDMCICSIREAFDRSGRSPGSSAIDYVS